MDLVIHSPWPPGLGDMTIRLYTLRYHVCGDTAATVA